MFRRTNMLNNLLPHSSTYTFALNNLDCNLTCKGRLFLPYKHNGRITGTTQTQNHHAQLKNTKKKINSTHGSQDRAERIAPFLSADAGINLYYGGSSYERLLVSPRVSAGIEFIDDFLSPRQYTNMVLKVGFGWLAHDQYRHYDPLLEEVFYHVPSYASRATRERVRLAHLRRYRIEEDNLGDLDAVGVFEIVLHTDRLSVGDVLNKERGRFSIWHWLPLVPKGKVRATLYQPVFDGDEINSGTPAYALEVQAGLTRHLYLILKHTASPNYREPYRSASLHLHLIGIP